jgi:hypothetical protein
MSGESIHDAYKAELDAFERKYFAHPIPPTGFHKLFDVQGNEIPGGAFYCPRCKVHTLGAGNQVRHCGRVEIRPSWWKRLFKKTPAWHIRLPL